MIPDIACRLSRTTPPGISGANRNTATPKDLSVVVVGAGALGNGVCQTLGLLGVGTVTVVDCDDVISRNLDYCTLLRTRGAVGKPKARVLAAAAGKLFPETRWRALVRWFAEVGFGDIADAHVVFSCVDNEMARLEIASACLQMGVPLVDAGLAENGGAEGRITWFPSPAAACFACMIPPGRLSRLLQGVDSARGSCSGRELQRGVTGLASPSLGLIVGGGQAETGVRLILDNLHGDPAAVAVTTTWRVSIAGFPRGDTYTADRRTDCPFHKAEGKDERVAGPWRTGVPVEKWLSAAGAQHGVMLDWPLCVEARCTGCGVRSNPFRFLSVVRWHMRCVECGGQLAALTSLRALKPGDDWQRKPLESLGLSPHHWYRRRAGTG
jgi:molybdopterin/thiamine biosynthesis adenylyltransferase